MRVLNPDKGIFSIGVVAEMLGLSPRQLRLYEEKGIIKPARTVGNHRLYSQRNIELLTYAHYLASVRRVTVHGLKVIVELLDLLPGRERERVIKAAEDYLGKQTKAAE
ncbi:MAG: MerR family transcriptional regulator [Myxococcales bacterium]|nr:MAG: MerR family transcriptional regulator [Myxococcales bacterium]